MEADPFSSHVGDDELEEDVCRVCRLEADEENPMVHPCKCSGSVRFVHPDCLKSWLATSKKKVCEICGHHYTFTKVYPDYIPETIPPIVYARQVTRYMFSWVMYIYRCWIVMAVWLIVLPMANMGGMKTFGWFVDHTISGILPSELLSSANNTQIINATLHDVAQNATAFEIADQSSSDVLQVVLTSKLGPGLSLRIAKRLWRMYRGSNTPNITLPVPAPLPAPPQVRSFLFFSSFDAPSPYKIFQGQMLSIALAATIVSVIFLREWFASHNWAQHEQVVAPTDDIVIPEEWVIRRGVAERRYTQLPNGKLVPLLLSQKKARKEKRLKALREAKEAAEDDWTDEGDDGKEGRRKPLISPLANIDRARKARPDMYQQQRVVAAVDGPGPSSMAYRRRASFSASDTSEPGEDNALHTDDQLSSDIERVRVLIKRAETIQQARLKLAEGRTDDAAWKAPELLASRKGKEKATGNGIEVAGPIAGAEGTDSKSEESESVTAPNPALASEPTLREVSPLPADHLSDRPAQPLLLDTPYVRADSLSTLDSAPTPCPALRRNDSLAPLKRLVSQINDDLQILSDRRAALQQDAKVLIQDNENPDQSPTFVGKEIEVFKVRVAEMEAASTQASERLEMVMDLTERFGDLAGEIEEIFLQDSSAEAVSEAAPEATVEGEVTGPAAKTTVAELLSILDSLALRPTPGQIDEMGSGVHSEPAVARAAVEPILNMPPLFAPRPMPWERPAAAVEALGTAPPVVPAEPTDGSKQPTSHTIANAEASSSTPTPLPAELAQGDAPSSPEPAAGSSSKLSDDDTTILQSVNLRGNNEVDIAQYMSHKNRDTDPKAEASAKRFKDRWDPDQDDGDADHALQMPYGAVEAGEDEEEGGRETGAEAEVDKEESEAGEPAIQEEPEIEIIVPAVEEGDEDEPVENAEPLDIVFDEEDEEGGWAADDWDQILEVIGLIGPYSALIQNLILAIAVMGATMSTCVLFPMTFGKIILCTDPIRTVLRIATTTWKISRKLLRWTRYLTDPIIDIGLEIVRDVLLKPFGGAFAAAEKILARVVGLERTASPVKVSQNFGLLSKAKKIGGLLLFSQSSKSDQASRSFVIALPQTLVARFGSLPSTITLTNPWSAMPSLATGVDALERLGNKSYHAYESYRVASVRIAMSDKLGDAVSCLAVGYIAALISLTALAWMGEKGMIKVNGGWKQGLRRYRLSIKLVMFLALELIAFPLGAGALIALSTHPLIPSSSLRDRLAGMKETAFGMVFITWLIGTMFMYGFAQVLAWCRSLCRPGALYFVRDPLDPTYSPVKEIINRSTTAQFHKLGISTIMYSFLIWWVFGAVPWGLRAVMPNSILPLRLDKFGPISPIPFDYLFLLIAIPPTIYRIRPQQTLKRLLAIYWRIFEGLLRLDHLLYANPASHIVIPPPTTPGHIETTIWNTLDIPFKFMFGSYDSSATLARVPAQDRIHILSTRTEKKGVRREGMFVLLTGRGQPKTPKDKIKMIRQDLIARRAERDPKDDFKIVQLPANWRTRIHVFILCLLAGGGVFLGMFVLCPVVLGREIMKARFGQVHDGYSFLAGAYTIYAALLAGRHAYRITVSFGRARQRRLASRQALVKRFILLNLRKALILSIVYVAHPIMKGLLWELRVGLLVRYGIGQAIPVLHLWDAWALGSVLNSIGLGACGLFGRHRGADNHRMHHLWRSPFRHNLRHLGAILLPEFRSLLLDLVLPFLYTICVAAIRGKDSPFLPLQFRAAGLVTWATRAMVVRIPTAGARWSAWRQRVIDAEYVVEERVENYEPEAEAEKSLEAKVDEVKKDAEGFEEGHVNANMDGEELAGPREVVLDGGEVLVVPVDNDVDESGATDSDEEDQADGVGTGEASEVDLE